MAHLKRGNMKEWVVTHGGWDTPNPALDMVLRYTRSVRFEDRLKLYQRIRLGTVLNVASFTNAHNVLAHRLIYAFSPLVGHRDNPRA